MVLSRERPTLATPMTGVRSVGVRSAARLARLGIHTAKDLLWHLPSRYEDYSQRVPISQLIPGEKMSIQGRVRAVASRFIWPKRLTITTATIEDESGAIRAVWFNQPYIEEALNQGVSVSLAGKVVLDKRGLYLASPLYEKTGPLEGESSPLRHTGRLVPIYPETDGVTSKYLRYLIQPLLEQIEIHDPLPGIIRNRYGLMDLDQAIRTVHYPVQVDDVEKAKERLAFDDLLLFQLKALHDRRLMNGLRAPRMPLDETYMKAIVGMLPFTLTQDQRVAALEVLRDMEKPYPMNRLMEGDVGSGKTVVALLAAFHVARYGRQTVLLAPTEVLAMQHYATLSTLAATQKFHTALLTGAYARLDGGEVSKAAVKKAIASGVATIIIGTHALLEEGIRFSHLGFVVIDEQHRFGVVQRAALTKTVRDDHVPHLLSMTATPIPRTLALTIFGDLDISVIHQKPKGRKTIITSVVPASGRQALYRQIHEQVAAGRQVFVICPKIEASTGQNTGRGKQQKLQPLWAEVKAVQEEYQRLTRDIFPDLRIAMLHGKMKAAQKQQIMHEFKEGWYDMLVSTSVIEVGVDVPNATVMLIEGADRFGLAQLHQFRGRVGRGEHQSYCFLVPTDDGAARARLAAMEKSDDGFILAETDMTLRGPGEFFGIKQSGMPDLTMAALANVGLIKQARTAARAILKSDPELTRYPLLREQLRSFRNLSHFE